MTNFILGTLFGITVTCFVKKIINDMRLAKVRDLIEDIDDDIDLEELLNELDESEKDCIVKTIVIKKDEEEEED